MLPKKPSDHIISIIETTDHSEELIKAIVSFYWADVRKALIELKNPNILVNSLGTFKIKHWKLESLEKRLGDYYTGYKRKKHSINFQNFAIMKELETKLLRVQNVRRLVERDKAKKAAVKLKRYGPKEHLDKPKENT